MNTPLYTAAVLPSSPNVVAKPENASYYEIRNAEELQKPLIAIVDDVPESAGMAAIMLRTQGFYASVLSSGQELFESFRYQHPDLILLDIAMPNMDGLEVCRRLKTMKEMSDIPVIFLTVHTEKAHKMEAFELGAVDFVTKPVELWELILRVRAHVELKQAREQLARQNLELQRLTKEKDEFFGMAVHELKNPLSGISAMAQFMQEPDTPEQERRSLLNLIVKSSEEIFVLLNDLLRINRMEQQGVQITLEPCDVSIITLQLVESYALKARAKSLTIRIDAPKNVMVLADEAALLHVLDNVLSNALKFSPPQKSITLRVIESGQSVRIEVHDEGPGISLEDQKRLFGKFVQLAAKPTAGENSTGLGLSIAKRFVDAMKGQIRCESEVGHGATFIVELQKAEEPVE